MNIVLFGSTDLTLSVAEFLYTNSYQIAAVVTVPQTFKISYKPEGVHNARFVDLDHWASEKNIPVINYVSADSAIDALKNFQTEESFAIVVGWYHMMPKKLRDIFPIGCSGFHASLLPKLRGGAPLNWALLLGHQEAGVSFFELSDGIDDGLLYDQMSFSIEKGDVIGTLVKKSEDAILQMLQRSLLKIQDGAIRKYEQEGLLSYCGQRSPEDSHINWKDDAEVILRLIKASSKPYAGAYSFLEEKRIIIWDASIADIEIHGIPGQIMIIQNKIYISCAKRAILLQDVEEKELLMKSNHKRLHFV